MKTWKLLRLNLAIFLTAVAPFAASAHAASAHGGGSDGGSVIAQFDKAQINYLLQEIPVTGRQPFSRKADGEKLLMPEQKLSRLKLNILNFLKTSIAGLDQAGKSDRDGGYVLSDDYFQLAKEIQNTRYVSTESGCPVAKECAIEPVRIEPGQITFFVDIIAARFPSSTIQQYAKILGALALRGELQNLRLPPEKIAQFSLFVKNYVSEEGESQYDFAANVEERDAGLPLSAIHNPELLANTQLLLLQYSGGKCSFGQSAFLRGAAELLDKDGQLADFNPLQNEKLTPLIMYQPVHVISKIPANTAGSGLEQFLIRPDEANKGGFYPPVLDECLPRRQGCILGADKAKGGQYCVSDLGAVSSDVGGEVSLRETANGKPDLQNLQAPKTRLLLKIEAVWPTQDKIIVSLPEQDLWIRDATKSEDLGDSKGLMHEYFLMNVRDFEALSR